MADQAYAYQFRVSLHDTDAAGVLFFAHLFRHAHDAYEAWMGELGFALDEMIRDGGLALPLVHAEADFKRPLRHGDLIRVEVRVDELRASSFGVGYRFLTDDGILAAIARTVHVAIRPGDSASRVLPDDLAATLRSRLDSSAQRRPAETQT